MISKKNIFIWSLYDFGNSFVFITFTLYFSKWLVVDRGLSDLWYNATFILGSIGLLIFGPWLGSRADMYNRERRYLTLSTIGCFIFYVFAIISAVLNFNIYFSALFFGLGNFFYQLSFVFYTPLLDNISTSENKGRISGIGFLGNYLGQIVGIATALPLISGQISLGVPFLIAPLIPSTIFFILLSMPLMLKKEIYEKPNHSPNPAMGQIGLIRSTFVIPGVLFFMLSYFLFSDAILTMTNNFSIYTSNIFIVNDTDLSILTLFIIISAGLGALLWGFASDKMGSKRALLYNLAAWIIIIPAVAWIMNYSLFFVFGILAGVFIGGTFAVSRQLLIELVPKNMLNYIFGIYTVFERAATILGPAVWVVILGIGGYRWAMFSMVFFQVFAFWFLYKIKIKKPQLAKSAI